VNNILKDMTQIKLGMKVKDKITEFKGILTAKVEYLYGCTQLGITPKLNKNGKAETIYFDEGRIEMIGKGIKPSTVKVKKNGGPSNNIKVGGRI